MVSTARRSIGTSTRVRNASLRVHNYTNLPDTLHWLAVDLFRIGCRVHVTGRPRSTTSVRTRVHTQLCPASWKLRSRGKHSLFRRSDPETHVPPSRKPRDREAWKPRARFFADIAVFDSDGVADHATYEDPHRFSSGVIHVLVNGQLVIEEGAHTGATPGRVVRGPGWTGGQDRMSLTHNDRGRGDPA